MQTARRGSLERFQGVAASRRKRAHSMVMVLASGSALTRISSSLLPFSALSSSMLMNLQANSAGCTQRYDLHVYRLRA